MYSNRHIAKVTTPILLSLLAQNFIQLIDTAFLGRVGEIELGASALAGTIYIVLFTIGFGYSMGSQIVIGRRNGEGNYHRIGDIVIQGMLFLLIPSILLIPLLKYGAAHWIPMLFKSDAVAHAVDDYLQWRVFGIVFAYINVMFRAFYIGTARTKVLTMTAIVMAVVNIIFDYLLIFGHYGFPELGIKGAAIASVMAEAAAALFCFFYTRFTVDLKKYGFNRVRLQWEVIRPVLSISIFMMVQYLLSMITWMLFFVFVENNLGERPLAVTNIIRSLYAVLTIPAQALGACCSTLVSNTIGADRKHEVIPLIKRMVLIGFFVILSICVLAAISPTLMIHIYTTDASLTSDTILPFYSLLTSMCFYAVGCLLFNAVSGTGNTRTALVFELVTLVFYVLYMWLTIVHYKLPVEISWTAEHLYWFLLAVMSFIYLRSGKWKYKQI